MKLKPSRLYGKHHKGDLSELLPAIGHMDERTEKVFTCVVDIFINRLDKEHMLLLASYMDLTEITFYRKSNIGKNANCST